MARRKRFKKMREAAKAEREQEAKEAAARHAAEAASCCDSAEGNGKRRNGRELALALPVVS